MDIERRCNGVPNQYFVRLKESSRKQLREFAREIEADGVEVIYSYNTLPGFAVRIDESGARMLRYNKRVAEVEQDQFAFLAMTVNSWGLDRIDQERLPLNGVFHPSHDGAGVNVYVLDSGVTDASGFYFGSRLKPGISFFPPSHGTDTQDCDDHGTPVAGIIGARAFGVASGVSIVPVRVWCGEGWASSIAAGVEWVAWHAQKERCPAVANISLYVGLSSALNTIVRAAIHSGVTFVVAAGNSDQDVAGFSPASVSEAMTVAASSYLLDDTDTRWFQSNYGCGVDVFAPGQDVNSVGASGASSSGLSGTSFASAHVAGAAAAYLGQCPGAKPDEVRTAIVDSASKNNIVNPAGSPNRLLFLRR